METKKIESEKNIEKLTGPEIIDKLRSIFDQPDTRFDDINEQVSEYINEQLYDVEDSDMWTRIAEAEDLRIKDFNNSIPNKLEKELNHFSEYLTEHSTNKVLEYEKGYQKGEIKAPSIDDIDQILSFIDTASQRTEEYRDEYLDEFKKILADLESSEKVFEKYYLEEKFVDDYAIDDLEKSNKYYIKAFKKVPQLIHSYQRMMSAMETGDWAKFRKRIYIEKYPEEWEEVKKEYGIK